jgi:TonB family protein
MNAMRWKIALLTVTTTLLLLAAVAQEFLPHPTHLPIPTYPPLAIQADISGRVQIELTIGADGTVKSWKVVSGHPVLARAVTDSLPQAQFACDGCREPTYSYTLTYQFALPKDRFERACAELAKTGKEPAMPPSTQDSATHVTVRPAHAMCMVADPATPRVRSVRCLWLWKCGLRLTPPRQALSGGLPNE